MDTQELLNHRMRKFRKLGGFQEGIPIDSKRKVNMKKKEEPVAQRGEELEGEIEKLKEQILKAKQSSTKAPELGLNEMIVKLKKEVDIEFSEAVKSVGLKDRLVMLREEFAKARNSQGQIANSGLKEKIEKLKDEFDQSLSTAPNYSSLQYKLDMLKEITKAKNLAEKNEKAAFLRQEINNKFKEVMEQPGIKEKIEALRGEIGDTSGDLENEMKEKVMQVKKEIELELTDVLKSLSLDVEAVESKTKYPINERSLSDFKVKVNVFNEEIKKKIDDAINSPDLKSKVEMLKLEIAKAEKTPDLESKNQIEALEQQIKQRIAEAINSPELIEKHEKLKMEISKAIESSRRSDGSLKKEDLKDDNANVDGSRVEINLGANRSFA